MGSRGRCPSGWPGSVSLWREGICPGGGSQAGRRGDICPRAVGLPQLSPEAPQVVEDGYEFFAKRQLVTLFSAPNYCGEFDNAGAMMSVDETLMCSFQVGCSSGGRAGGPGGGESGGRLPAAPHSSPDPQILKPADKNKGKYGQFSGLNPAGRPVTPPRNSAKAKK